MLLLFGIKENNNIQEINKRSSQVGIDVAGCIKNGIAHLSGTGLGWREAPREADLRFIRRCFPTNAVVALRRSENRKNMDVNEQGKTPCKARRFITSVLLLFSHVPWKRLHMILRPATLWMRIHTNFTRTNDPGSPSRYYDASRAAREVVRVFVRPFIVCLRTIQNVGLSLPLNSDLRAQMFSPKYYTSQLFRDYDAK